MTEIVINKESGDIDKIIASLHEMGHDLFAEMASKLIADHPDEDEEVEKYCAEKLPVATISAIKAIIGN